MSRLETIPATVPPTNHSPRGLIYTGSGAKRCWSIAFSACSPVMTLTSCSGERPPRNTATRVSFLPGILYPNLEGFPRAR